jgi:hypothetical protein
MAVASSYRGLKEWPIFRSPLPESGFHVRKGLSEAQHLLAARTEQISPEKSIQNLPDSAQAAKSSHTVVLRNPQKVVVPELEDSCSHKKGSLPLSFRIICPTTLPLLWSADQILLNPILSATSLTSFILLISFYASV